MTEEALVEAKLALMGLGEDLCWEDGSFDSVQNLTTLTIARAVTADTWDNAGLSEPVKDSQRRVVCATAL